MISLGGNVKIPGSEFLNSVYTLFPLAAVFSKRDSLSGTEEAALKRWFVVANAFSWYSGSPETILDQDLKALGPECSNADILLQRLLRGLRTEPKVSPQDLERAGTASPFFPLSYLAAVRHDATDWFKGVKLRRREFSEDHKIEYHHIFPKKLLNARGVDRYLRDEMSNLAFLGSESEQPNSRQRRPRTTWPDRKPRPKRLEAQFVPMDRALWELDRFEDFLAARRELLANAMNKAIA